MGQLHGPDETKTKQQANWSRRLMLLRPAGFPQLKVTYTVQTHFSLAMHGAYVHCDTASGALNHSQRARGREREARADNSFFCRSRLEHGVVIMIAFSGGSCHFLKCAPTHCDNPVRQQGCSTASSELFGCGAISVSIVYARKQRAAGQLPCQAKTEPVLF